VRDVALDDVCVFVVDFLPRQSYVSISFPCAMKKRLIKVRKVLPRNLTVTKVVPSKKIYRRRDNKRIDYTILFG
jgi:hypothetical protein